MGDVFIQLGHCHRKKGSTGTEGEQGFARHVGGLMERLLEERGHKAELGLADQGQRQADLFVALHCDGSLSESAGGASVGWQDSNGERAGKAWKRAYQARGWAWGFRPDNYTPALANYYGVRNARTAGTPWAIIVEHGFLTNPAERAWLTSDAGATIAAWAIVDLADELLGRPAVDVSKPIKKEGLVGCVIQPATGPKSEHAYVAWHNGTVKWLPALWIADHLVSLEFLRSAKVVVVPEPVFEMFSEVP